MSRPRPRLPRVLTIVAFVCLAACATPSATPPADVEILDTGYRVDNTILATTDELRAFLADLRVTAVRLVTAKTTSRERIDAAATAARDAGLAVAIAPR